jgi:predicted esterase
VEVTLPSVPPSLLRSDADDPRAVVLVLHGGQQHSTQPVGRSLSWLRAAALQRAVAPTARRTGAATWLLRYRQRGWNGGAPVDDARWALERVRHEVGEVPVVLLGHSMGARTAVHAAADPAVTGVIALAPWFPPGEPTRGLAGKHLHAAHGRRDRITSYAATEAYVERARSVAASATLRDMGPTGHYLLHGLRDWNRVAIDGVRSLLEG